MEISRFLDGNVEIVACLVTVIVMPSQASRFGIGFGGLSRIGGLPVESIGKFGKMSRIVGDG